MPIEFRCQQCQKLLRTGDETAGKQAKCPACGSVQTIPVPGAAPGAAPYNVEADPYAGRLAPPVATSNPFAVSDNPYQSPSAAPPIRALGHQDPARTFQPTIIEAGDVLSRTWIIFKANMTMTVVALLVVGAVAFGISMVLNMIAGVIIRVANDQATFVVVQIILFLINQLFSGWLYVGLASYMLQIARGEEGTFANIFSSFQWVLPYFLASLCYTLAVLAGSVLCIVPGVIMALMFGQFAFLIVDRNARVIESLQLSATITNGNKLTLFLLGLCAFGINLVGILACCVGLIFSTGFVVLMTAVAYLAMTGQRTGDQLIG